MEIVVTCSEIKKMETEGRPEEGHVNRDETIEYIYRQSMAQDYNFNISS